MNGLSVPDLLYVKRASGSTSVSEVPRTISPQKKTLTFHYFFAENCSGPSKFGLEAIGAIFEKLWTKNDFECIFTVVLLLFTRSRYHQSYFFGRIRVGANFELHRITRTMRSKISANLMSLLVSVWFRVRKIYYNYLVT